MAQLGNKKNSQLNGEWATHVRKRDGGKRYTSGARRRQGKEEICQIINERHQRGESDVLSVRLISG